MSEETDIRANTTELTREVYGVGLLGVTINHPNVNMATDARLHEIERRILRIEATLRRTGLDVGMTDFPQVRP